jgi:nitrogen regulatory protein PII
MGKKSVASDERLSRIEIISSMSKFSSLKSALSKAGIRGMTVMQVLGCGVEKGTREFEIDENYEMELLPKEQISIVVETQRVPEIVELVKHELYTGHIGDGKIFVYSIDNVIRVRTGDEGIEAL